MTLGLRAGFPLSSNSISTDQQQPHELGMVIATMNTEKHTLGDLSPPDLMGREQVPSVAMGGPTPIPLSNFAHAQSLSAGI